MTTISQTHYGCMRRLKSIPAGDPKGFTLIELMVVLAIISILGSLSMAGLMATRQRTKIVRTETTIRKIHEVVMPHYEQIINRNIREVPIIPVSANNPPLSPTQTAVAAQGMQLIARRRLAALELPDGWAEVKAETGSPLKINATDTYSFSTGITRRLRNVATAANAPPNDLFGDAECLWAAVMRGGFADPGIVSHFRADEFGDTDGDGAREFMDAWNKPIRFLRWAPMFISRYQPAADDNIQDHDAFDFAGVDPLARCTLFPLIFSGGPDGEPDIVHRGNGFNYATVAFDPYFAARPVYSSPHGSHLYVLAGSQRPLAPYSALPSAPLLFGSTINSSPDDVHNHMMSR